MIFVQNEATTPTGVMMTVDGWEFVTAHNAKYYLSKIEEKTGENGE